MQNYPNPERYVCYPANQTSTGANYLATGWIPEFLNLTNGVDDDGDGWIDESCDGIDNDGDGIIDPGYNGLDDDGNGSVDEYQELGFGLDSNKKFSTTAFSEFEQEVFLGVEAGSNYFRNENYTIIRRPVVSPGAAETTLPAGVVIDLTTWNVAAATPTTAFQNGTTPALLPERSRLPVDPFSGYVDILIDQGGRVVPPGAGSGGGGYYANSPLSSTPFYHFWITEREGVVAPLWDPAQLPNPYVPATNPNYDGSATSQSYFLPMPKGTFNPTVALANSAARNLYDPMPDGTQAQQNYSTNPVYLKGERRLVTLFTKTGQIVTNSIETFNVNDTSYPYYAAQSGIKESQ